MRLSHHYENRHAYYKGFMICFRVVSQLYLKLILILYFRFKLLSEGKKRFKTDGINTLKYKRIKVELNKLFTRVLVDVNESEILKVIL